MKAIERGEITAGEDVIRHKGDTSGGQEGQQAELIAAIRGLVQELQAERKR